MTPLLPRLARLSRGGGNCGLGNYSTQRRGGAEKSVEILNEGELNRLSGIVVDAAVQVHKALGPGVLESAYAACMAYELRERGLVIQTQVELPIVYKNVQMETGYRMDLLVEEAVVVELKTVTAILPVHEAQVLTYLKLSRCRLGLLLNFYVPKMRDGIKRLVNNL
jgi:GxxExxY protein